MPSRCSLATPTRTTNLGIALAATKRNEEAIAHYRKALSINPRFTKAHNNLGNVLGSALGRHEEAVTCYEQGLAIAPNDPEIRNNLGVSLAALDRAEQAVAQYARALALRPSYAEAHNNLAATLETLFRFEEAAAHCRKAITIRLDYPEAHNTLGNVLKALDRHSEALECYQKAIKLRPDYAQACSNMGDTLRELGRADEARRSYQTAVALSPDTPRFLRRLVESTSMTAHDPHMASLRGLAEDTTLATEEQIELQFALAKALGDIGEPAQAFRHLAQGNALKRRTIRYDETATLGLLDRIQAQFTPAMMQPRQGRGNRSVVPVFVVGMIRSGTTLVEQILASHPDVHGAGERTDFANLLARKFTGLTARSFAFRRALRRSAAQSWSSSGRTICAESRLRHPQHRASWTRCRGTFGSPEPSTWLCRMRASSTSTAIRSIPACHASRSCSPAINPLPTISASLDATTGPTGPSWSIGVACCRRRSCSRSNTRS